MMSQQSPAQVLPATQRARRAHYLLAMGITPWVDRSWEPAPPAAQAASEPVHAGDVSQAADIHLVVLLSPAVQQSLSWTEPPGRLLLNMLRALGIDPKKVAFGTPPGDHRQVPCWQFGNGSGPGDGFVLPELDAMLADPALKKAAWQILRGGKS